MEKQSKWTLMEVRLAQDPISDQSGQMLNNTRDEFAEDEKYDRDEASYKEWAYKASQSDDHSKFAGNSEQHISN